MSMQEEQGLVESIEPRVVNTRYGSKTTTSFVINGVTYSGGFKKWDSVKIGDEVFITFETTDKGYRNIKGLTVVNAGTGGPVANSAPKSNSGGGGGYSKGGGRSFPVDPLAPERTINRQNALTNAVKYAEYYDPKASKEDIVEVARYFEAYTTGDIDMEEARALAEAS